MEVGSQTRFMMKGKEKNSAERIALRYVLKEKVKRGIISEAEQSEIMVAVLGNAALVLRGADELIRMCQTGTLKV